jgi:type I restriction-modification system DNA methylase subunit
LDREKVIRDYKAHRVMRKNASKVLSLFFNLMVNWGVHLNIWSLKIKKWTFARTGFFIKATLFHEKKKDGNNIIYINPKLFFLKSNNFGPLRFGTVIGIIS